MPEKVYYCPRCAKPAVRGDSATEEIWRCPTQHGIVYQAPLPAETPPETQAAASAQEPAGDHESEPPQGEDEEKEDAKPEARARAPAAHHRQAPKTVHPMPKKK